MQMGGMQGGPVSILKGFYETFKLVIHESSLGLHALLLHRTEQRLTSPKSWITIESGEEAS
jgi:hypothetical protein